VKLSELLASSGDDVYSRSEPRQAGPSNEQRREIMKFHEAEAVTAAAAGLTVYGLVRTGLGSRIPALDGLSSAIVAIILGAFLAVIWDGQGTVGNALEGVGYGLIAYGVLSFASA
jgi:uncharacterized membrane protein